MRYPPPRLLVFLVLALGVGIGCQKARVYDPRAVPKAEEKQPDNPAVIEEKPEDIPLHFGWMDPGRNPLVRDVAIAFVHHDASPEDWKALPLYWNEVGIVKPGEVAAVRIKVPLGLDDPSAYLSPVNPPTRSKWGLGRKLFFDPTWLTPKSDLSCHTCHRSSLGFTDGKANSAGGLNASTLVNVVYQPRLFWDGRAAHLEEVVGASLDDERSPKQPGPFRHVWPGVIGRLRGDSTYLRRFHEVFGTSPTQDAVGAALATYLRTLLAGNSLYDRAAARRKGTGPVTVEHFEAVLDRNALESLNVKGGTAKSVAVRLAAGAQLFRGKGACVSCHPAAGGTFSDGRFHNIGVGLDGFDKVPARLGRFDVAPLGEKNRYLRGAWRTPTLRGLTRTGPYFHNGEAADLRAAVRAHLVPRAGARNPYLAPGLATTSGERRDFGLSEDDIESLVLFLAALSGEEVDRSVLGDSE